MFENMASTVMQIVFLIHMLCMMRHTQLHILVYGIYIYIYIYIYIGGSKVPRPVYVYRVTYGLQFMRQMFNQLTAYLNIFKYILIIFISITNVQFWSPILLNSYAYYIISRCLHYLKWMWIRVISPITVRIRENFRFNRSGFARSCAVSV